MANGVRGTAGTAWRRSGESVLAAAVFWLVMATVALAPLPLGANRPWAWSLLALLAGLALLGWAVAALADPGLMRLSWHRHVFVTVPFCLAVAWALVQAAPWTPAAWHHPLWADAAKALGRPLVGAISLDPDRTVEGAMRLAAYGAVFWLAMQYGRDAARARDMFWVVALAALAYAVYGLTAHLAGTQRILWFPKWAYHDSLTSTFVNRNSYAAYAGLGLVAITALAWHATRRLGDHGLASRAGWLHVIDNLTPGFFLLIVAAVTVATALLLTGSRGGALCTGLGLVALIASLAAMGHREGRRGTVLFGIFLATGIALLTYSGGLLLGRLARVISGPTGREAIHSLTREMIADRPLLGGGLGSFPQLFGLYRDARLPFESLPYDQAHSTYLELGAELGLIGAGLLGLALAAIALVCLRGAAIRRRDRLFPCAALAAAVLIGIHSVFDFSAQIPAVAVTLMVLLGAGFAQSWPSGDRRDDPAR